MNIFKKKSKKPKVSNPDINRSLLTEEHGQVPVLSPIKTTELDDFQTKNQAVSSPTATKSPRKEVKDNYEWDFCIVVPNPEHDSFKSKPLHKEFKPYTEILERLHLAELETYQFYSTDMDEIFIKIRAPLNILRRHAQNVEFKMLLDSNYIKKHVENLKEPIGEDPNHTKISPYDFIYASYDDSKYCLVTPVHHHTCCQSSTLVSCGLFHSSTIFKQPITRDSVFTQPREACSRALLAWSTRSLRCCASSW